MSLYQINGHMLHVEIQGEPGNPGVVLLHHGLGSVRAWRDSLPVLAHAGYFTVAYDRWGYGGSEPRSQLSMPYFQQDLQDLSVLLDRLSMETAALVGHSDGGTIALYYAAQHSKRVTALVSIAAHIYVEPKMGPGIEGVRQAYETDERFQQGLRRLHADKTDSVFYNWFNGWTARPENLAWDMRPVLRNIRCPSLIIQGIEDEHATPQHARDIAEAIPGARLWLAPGAAHMLPQEQPELFNRRLLEFLGETQKNHPLQKERNLNVQ
jgi:pimeloyl-ACP methyl ester carboxylesterase